MNHLVFFFKENLTSCRAIHSQIKSLGFVVLASPDTISKDFIQLFANPISSYMHRISCFVAFCIPPAPLLSHYTSFFDSQVPSLSPLLCNKN
jgi:hypothetical protein